MLLVPDSCLVGSTAKLTLDQANCRLRRVCNGNLAVFFDEQHFVAGFQSKFLSDFARDGEILNQQNRPRRNLATNRSRQMKVIAIIEDRDEIKHILRHLAVRDNLSY